jgi:hypothetical protein
MAVESRMATKCRMLHKMGKKFGMGPGWAGMLGWARDGWDGERGEIAKSRVLYMFGSFLNLKKRFLVFFGRFVQANRYLKSM